MRTTEPSRIPTTKSNGLTHLKITTDKSKSPTPTSQSSAKVMWGWTSRPTALDPTVRTSTGR